MSDRPVKSIIKWIGMLTVLLGCLVGCEDGEKVTELQGAGATFPYPLYSKMFDEYHQEFGPRINYQSIGSGGGIRQLKNQTVDFGATDAFMSDQALQKSDNDILHIPVCLGAVVLSYHLPGVSQLKLSPSVLADIFLGTITHWNHSRIQDINPDVSLPELRIVSVHRSDGSGTTFIFTDYLSKVSPSWLSKVGRGKSINWPDGLGGKGNAGVAGIVQQTPGAIGYIGHIYAEQNKMPLASIRNKSGHYILPSLESVSQAANTTIPDDTRASITDTSAKFGYPISGFTWILSYKEQKFNSRSIEQAKATKMLLKWMIGDGQRFVGPLLYAPLSEPVAKQAQAIIESMTYSGEAISI